MLIETFKPAGFVLGVVVFQVIQGVVAVDGGLIERLLGLRFVVGL